MATKLDARQLISRDALDHIASATGTELDDLLRSLNSEVTPPLRMNESSSPDFVLNVEAIEITNPETGKRRTIAPINDLIPNFTSGTVTIPSSNSGTIIVSPGNNVSLSIGSDEFAKAIVSITEIGNLVVDVGAGAATEALAPLPASTEGTPIGYFVIESVAGSTQFIENSAIVQFVSLGGASAAAAAGGGGADLLTQLTEAELGGLLPNTPNRILDSFDDDTKGIKTNCTASGDQLDLDPGETSGTYVRDKKASIVAESVNGVAVMRLRALAPENGQSFTTANPIVVDFDGDVTSYIQDGTTGLWATEDTTDTPSEPVYQHLLEANGKPAVFTITSAVFSSGSTTVTIANPNNLDFSMGLANTEHFDKLRLFPFDYSYEAYADGSTYETTNLDEAAIHGTAVTLNAVLTGAGQFSQKVAGDPSAENLDFAISPNKTYAVARVLQNTSGNDTWRWVGSKDGGETWFDIGTKTASVDLAPEGNGNFHWLMNNSQIIVADNGKMFSTYTFDNGTFGLYGVIADLSNATPSSTFANVAESPSGTINNTGSAATGRIMHHTSGTSFGIVGGDLTDLSLVCAHVVRTSDNVSHMLFWTNGGATHDSDSLSHMNSLYETPSRVILTRTDATNHRVHLVSKNTSNSLRYKKWDQTAGTVNTTATHDLEISSTADMLGADLVDESLHVAHRNTSNDNVYIRPVDNVATGTPALATNNIIMNNSSGVEIDSREGVTADANIDNVFKVSRNTVRINPSDENHVLFCKTMLQPYDLGGGSSFLYEIKDITDFEGITQSEYNFSIDTDLRQAGSLVRLGIPLSPSSERIRTVAFRVYQVGRIAEGETLTCKIHGDDSGDPDDGNVLATSTNTVDPSNITFNSTGEWIYFNFDETAIENLTGTYYAVVEGSYAINGSDYIRFKTRSAAGVGSNTFGASWGTSTNTPAHEVNGEWVSNVSLDLGPSLGPQGEARATAETQMEWVEEAGAEGTLALTFRRIRDYSSLKRDLSGHPYRRLLTLGSGSAGDKKVALGALKGLGYQDDPDGYELDDNLVFSVSLGDTSARSLVTTTGAETGGQGRMEERSGYLIVRNNNFDIDVTDGDFDSGFANDFNGSTHYIEYEASGSNGDHLNFDTDEDYVIECEMKADVFGVNFNNLVSKGTAANATYRLRMTPTGEINFFTNYGSVSQATGNTSLSTGTYYKIRVVYDGSTRKAKLYYSTDGVTYTEDTLAVDDTWPASTVIADGGDLVIGRQAAPADAYWDGEIGYVKIARAPNGIMDLTQNTTNQGPWAYPSYEDQAPIISHQNLGAIFGGKRVVGQNSVANQTTNYYEAWMVSPDEPGVSSVVDSYDQQLYFSKTLGNTGSTLGLRANLGRKSDDDDSSIQGLNFIYDKS